MHFKAGESNHMQSERHFSSENIYISTPRYYILQLFIPFL